MSECVYPSRWSSLMLVDKLMSYGSKVGYYKFVADLFNLLSKLTSKLWAGRAVAYDLIKTFLLRKSFQIR